MIEIFIKLYNLSDQEKPYIKKSVIHGLLYSLFELLQFLAVYIVLKAVAENGIGNTSVSTLIVMLISVAGCIYAHMKSNVNQMRAGLYMAADKRIEIGNNLRYAAMGFFNESSLGKISAAISSKLYLIENTVPSVLNNVIQGIIYTLVLLIGFTCFEWRIGVTMLLISLIYIGIIQLMFWATKKEAPKKQKAITELTEGVLEYIEGIVVIRSFQNDTSKIENKIKKVLKNNQIRELGYEAKVIPYTTFAQIILRCGTVIAAYITIRLFFEESIEIYSAALIIIWLYVMFNQLLMAGSMIATLQNIDTALNEINESGNPPLMKSGNQKFDVDNCDITMENVSFSYGSKNVLENINIVFPKNKTTAVVGYSGSGKTTLCSLIYRFWDVNSGIIRLGGTDIKEYNLDELLGNISVVFQNVYLFNDTVANNIRFGKPEATDEEIISAAKKACCHEFIMQLPDGYNTMVGENGAVLSGGEKQRISIARAIIKDAPIVILDEATSSIDPENESKIQTAIQELTRNKTVIMIAHRLNTIRNANKIIVMENGRIIQEGTHEELLKEGGVYSSLVNVRTEALGWKLVSVN